MLAPLVSFIRYHPELLSALDEGNLAPERLKEIKKLNELFCEIIPESEPI